MNKLLQFADDSLLSTENLFDLKRTINCLNLEIKKLGVQLNPQKCNLIVNNVNEEDEETETTEIFISETDGKQVTYDDNVSQKIKASRKERREKIKANQMTKGKHRWIHGDSRINEYLSFDLMKLRLNDNSCINIVDNFKYLGQMFSMNFETQR